MFKRRLRVFLKLLFCFVKKTSYTNTLQRLSRTDLRNERCIYDYRLHFTWNRRETTHSTLESEYYKQIRSESLKTTFWKYRQKRYFPFVPKAAARFFDTIV